MKPIEKILAISVASAFFAMAIPVIAYLALNGSKSGDQIPDEAQVQMQHDDKKTKSKSDSTLPMANQETSLPAADFAASAPVASSSAPVAAPARKAVRITTTSQSNTATQTEAEKLENNIITTKNLIANAIYHHKFVIGDDVEVKRFTTDYEERKKAIDDLTEKVSNLKCDKETSEKLLNLIQESKQMLSKYGKFVERLKGEATNPKLKALPDDHPIKILKSKINRTIGEIKGALLDLRKGKRQLGDVKASYAVFKKNFDEELKKLKEMEQGEDNCYYSHQIKKCMEDMEERYGDQIKRVKE